MKNEFIEQTWIILGEIPRIRIADGLSSGEARKIEKAFIAAIGRHPTGPLVNISPGGDGPLRGRFGPLSSEHRASLSDGQKIRWARASADERSIMLENLDFTGRQHKPESIEKIRAWHTGRPMPKTEKMEAAAAARRGIPLADETKKKMSIVRKGKPRPMGMWEKIRATRSKKSYLKTHCKYGHEFTPDNLYLWVKDGITARHCRTCMALRSIAQREARKAKRINIALGYVQADTARANPALKALVL